MKIFFGAFGGWYFLYFLGHVTVPPPPRLTHAPVTQAYGPPPQGEGDCKEGG